MNGQIEIQYLVDYCKQLPTFRDALPIMMFIKDWGIENCALDAAKQAEWEVREHFKLMNPQPDNDLQQPKKLPPTIIETPEIPELKFFLDVDDKDAAEFKEVLRECIAKINTKGKKEWMTVYMLVNDEGKYYYDDEKVNVPSGKVARQIGIYQYETNSGRPKTVPIVKFMDK